MLIPQPLRFERKPLQVIVQPETPIREDRRMLPALNARRLVLSLCGHGILAQEVSQPGKLRCGHASSIIPSRLGARYG